MFLNHGTRWSKSLLNVNKSICIESEYWKHISTSKTAYMLISQWTKQKYLAPKLPWKSDHERNRKFGRNHWFCHCGFASFQQATTAPREQRRRLGASEADVRGPSTRARPALVLESLALALVLAWESLKQGKRWAPQDSARVFRDLDSSSQPLHCIRVSRHHCPSGNKA